MRKLKKKVMFVIIYFRICCLLSENVKIKIYTIIVVYECKTWPLTLREEYRLRVFENRVLRRMFSLERVETIGGCEQLHNKNLQNFAPSQID
jgi:hypothetical protein